MSSQVQAHSEEKNAPSPKPEGVDDPTAGTGEAIEPEAMHNLTGGAKTAGDRMWGPPGTPEKNGKTSS